jgi:hypothetical protein
VGECIFCGGKPLTREHLWPRWLRDYFGTSHLPHRYGAAASSSNDVVDWNGPPATKTARLLCNVCNNDWGSRLEDAAKLLLLPMIQGHPKRLSQSSQRTATLWLAKTLMVMDRSHRRTTFVPEKDLRSLRAHDDLRTPAVAWISAYSGAQYAATAVTTPTETGDGWAGTIQVGELVMQMTTRNTVNGRFAREANEVFRKTRGWNVQIWPTAVVRRQWPPRHAKDDPAFETVAFPGRVPPR